MSHQARIPSAVVRYFGVEAEHPIVEQVFTPGRGWQRDAIRKRISASWARKLRREGVTHVALRCGARLADFRTDELTKP